MPPELLKEYDVTTRVLGVGTFAEVKEIKRKDDGKSFALKIILKKALQGKAAMMDTEIAVLSQVRHPNCVSLLAKFEDEHAYYLVTEMAEGGELFDQLLKKGHYTERDAARLIHEVLLGVEYLHSVGIVHRDLKPENLLFMDKTENSRLVITDFGLSKILTNGNHVLMTACGTPGYVAPEVLEQIGHGKPVDLWSTGVIAYTLLCGYTPFWGEDQPTLFENIIAGQYEYEDEYWKYISDEAKSFIDTLLVRPAERRTTATQALAHPWLSMMLEQGVNLAPGVRQNISAVNAKRAFRKTVQAVSVVRRLQAAGRMHAAARMQATVPSITSSERPNGEARANTTVSQAYDDVRGDSPEPSQPKPTSLGFRDVINMAVSANQDGKVPDASLDQTN
ncbi:kinase-like domain-containing protein [Mortierella sp. GBAus27b]|nr:kinase-like domain-containing protein [Mortierella sp. GBAus27b]